MLSVKVTLQGRFGETTLDVSIPERVRSFKQLKFGACMVRTVAQFKIFVKIIRKTPYRWIMWRVFYLAFSLKVNVWVQISGASFVQEMLRGWCEGLYIRTSAQVVTDFTHPISFARSLSAAMCGRIAGASCVTLITDTIFHIASSRFSACCN